jgi:hypothetical protein
MDLDEALEQEPGSTMRPPPRPAHLSKFTGESRKNWEMFEAFIGLHFDQYPSFFAVDRNRVTRASDYLDDAIKLDWARYVKKRKETTQGYPDWQEFSTCLSANIACFFFTLSSRLLSASISSSS